MVSLSVGSDCASRGPNFHRNSASSHRINIRFTWASFWRNKFRGHFRRHKIHGKDLNLAVEPGVYRHVTWLVPQAPPRGVQ